jgi:hypothetical protein
LRFLPTYNVFKAANLGNLKLLEIDTVKVDLWVFSVPELVAALDLGPLHFAVDNSHQYLVSAKVPKEAIVAEFSLEQLKDENRKPIMNERLSVTHYLYRPGRRTALSDPTGQATRLQWRYSKVENKGNKSVADGWGLYIPLYCIKRPTLLVLKSETKGMTRKKVIK